MSSTLTESPVSGSQLYFSWNESSGSLPRGVSQVDRHTPAVPGLQEEAVCHEATCQKAMCEEIARRGAEQAMPEPYLAVPVQTGWATTAHGAAADCLQFTAEGRVARPVRIGAVMIRLLKRYGISEAEIAEGLARYAQQRGIAAAS